MKKFKIMKKLCATLIFLVTSVSFAQEFDDNVEDVPTVPIDNYIWVLILFGLGYVFYKYRKLRSYEL